MNIRGDSCEQNGTAVIYKVSSCQNGYVLDDQGCSCITCSQAKIGWTLGNPPTRDCYSYEVKTICGQLYYKR